MSATKHDQHDGHVVQFRAAKVVKALEAELHLARASWSVFEAGNGIDPDDRRELHELLSHRDEVHVFRHLIQSSASMTVLSLCRLTDPTKQDRDCIPTLRKLICGKEELFAVAAYNWIPDWPDRQARNCQETRDGVTELIRKMKDFVKSPAVRSIRALRDEALAHRLNFSTERPTFDDIGKVFGQANEIVCEASLRLTGTSWDTSDFYEFPLQFANRFWDTFEQGLRKRTSEIPKRNL